MPNVVVSMPSQLFTLRRKFAAVSNGKVYIGKIDMDPTIPENQIQVYLENEDGLHVPVAQPIIINQAGYPVYNGQIAKFVTLEGHSMVVYDSYGAQQFYFSNILKYDPDQFKGKLKQPDGASMIGVQPSGNLQQMLNYVTPEQFGAIGDGNVHPLSERFKTLKEAQAVYPHVTSLEQSIDWAACQAAENYARGKTVVRCQWYAKYHFGRNDYLKLGQDSKWQGATLTATDRPGTMMIRNDPIVSPDFGQDCIVKVMTASEAGSSDEFVRGVVFEGFHLTRNLKRRPDVRGKNSIGLHLNYAMKAVIDVTVNGCDFGVLGYGCWGSVGTVRIDSCHKGIYLDGQNSNPEIAGKGSLTSINWRTEIDACVFPITLNSCGYSKFTGFYEGMRDSYTDLYKKDIETACGITIGSQCNNVDFFLGIEAFQGTHLTMGSDNNITLNNYYFNDIAYNSASGVNGAFAQIDDLMGRSTPQIKSPSRAFIFAHGHKNTVTIINPEYFGGNIIDDPDYIRYLYHMSTTCAITSVGGYINFSPLFTLTRVNWSLFRSINTRNIMVDYFPSNYTPLGNDIAIMKQWAIKGINSDGRVSINAPVGYKIIDFSAYVIISTEGQTAYAAIGIVSYKDDEVILQTSSPSGFSIAYKLTIQIIK